MKLTTIHDVWNVRLLFRIDPMNHTQEYSQKALELGSNSKDGGHIICERTCNVVPTNTKSGIGIGERSSGKYSKNASHLFSADYQLQ